MAEGRATGPAAAAAAQVSSGGAGEWNATGSRRRQGNPAQPSWAWALPRGRSGTPQAWEEAAEDPAPTVARTPSPCPLPRDSAGAGPAQDRGHTVPESRVPAWRHLEPPSQARFPGLPRSHPLGLGCRRAALFSWGPSACRHPQDEPLPWGHGLPQGEPWRFPASLPQSWQPARPRCTATALPVVSKL